MRSVKGALTNICGAWAELQCGPQEREDSDGPLQYELQCATVWDMSFSKIWGWAVAPPMLWRSSSEECESSTYRDLRRSSSPRRGAGLGWIRGGRGDKYLEGGKGATAACCVEMGLRLLHFSPSQPRNGPNLAGPKAGFSGCPRSELAINHG
jgi:hypothetical protein